MKHEKPLLSVKSGCKLIFVYCSCVFHLKSSFVEMQINIEYPESLHRNDKPCVT